MQDEIAVIVHRKDPFVAEVGAQTGAQTGAVKHAVLVDPALDSAFLVSTPSGRGTLTGTFEGHSSGARPFGLLATW